MPHMSDYSSQNHTFGQGYFVSTVGIDERVIREYIRNQKQNDRNHDQGCLFKQHQQLDQLNYRFERFTMEAFGFAEGDSLTPAL